VWIGTFLFHSLKALKQASGSATIKAAFMQLVYPYNLQDSILLKMLLLPATIFTRPASIPRFLEFIDLDGNNGLKKGLIAYC
jgi:hypothetical protein